MKNCYYNGNLHEDIKLINQKVSFNWKKFRILTGVSIIAAIIGCGIVALVMGKITGATIGSFIGITLVNSIKNIKQSKRDNWYVEEQLVNLYKEINDQYSKPISSSLAKSKMKDCIVQTQKVNDIKRDQNNKVISKTEKIIKYFYLLDASDKIQVLRQVKEVITSGKDKIENNDLYLLEAEDIKEEKLEIPVVKTLKLRDDNK